MLSRFTEAQAGGVYEKALAEIKAGLKRSHWMWFIFPQLKCLGFSSTAQYYGIADLAEAKAYLADPVLGSRLREISAALLALKTDSPYSVFGSPDDLKLRSSMTLFSLAAPEEKLFSQVLDKFYAGARCEKTEAMLRGNK
jgi:uncharacterized protein (DUF1810 family)